MRLSQCWPAAIVAGLVRSTGAAAFRAPAPVEWTPDYQQPQLRALNEETPLTGGGALEAADGDTDIITATYGNSTMSPAIRILDARNRVKWSWGGAEMRRPELTNSADLRGCLVNTVNAVEVKMADDGKKVIVLFSQVALVINHTPDNPDTDKKVVWGACRGDLLPGAHTLEMLPGGLLAIGTTGQSMEHGIVVFDLSLASADDPNASDKGPQQHIHNFPAIHALVWDEAEKLLWAAGNNVAADGRMGKSYGQLNAYAWNGPASNSSESKQDPRAEGEGEGDGKEPPPALDPTPKRSYQFPTTHVCDVQWGHDTGDGKFWDGPHDIAPLPNERKFLITTDLDIHSFDLKTHKFDCCESVADQYLRGFSPVDDRSGVDYETGKKVAIPRSDLKSVGVAGDKRRTTLYTQAHWRTYLDDRINILVDGIMLTPLDPGPGGIYRARWFAQIPGWEKAG